MSSGRSLAPLREPMFRWYFGARTVNIAGNAMASVALAFAVLDITDSASALGQVLAAHTIPLVIFLLVGGVVADRFPRSVVLQVSNISSFLLQGLAATLVITGQAEIWMLVVIEFFHGMTSALAMPAMSALTPQLVPRDMLQQANALLSMSRAGVTVVGPSLAAVLVVTVGPGWALAADAFTWAIAALLMFGVRPPRAARQERTPSVVRELREGWTLIRTTTWMWVVVLAFGVLNAIHAGALLTLGPVLAKSTIGEGGWGLGLSAEAVGVLLMTVALLRLRIRYPLRTGMLAIGLLGVPIAVLGSGAGVAAFAVTMFIAGAGMEVFNLGWNLAMQENVDEGMLSRAYSYDALGSFVAMPVGQLLYGPLGESFGYEKVMVTSGFVYVGICLLTLLSASVRRLPRADAVSGPTAQPAT